jgi:DNA mismatch repair protein MutH
MLDEAELSAKLATLEGRTLGEVARYLGTTVPGEPRRAKGFAGQLVERALGLANSSRPEPDFAALGIELKTVPVDAQGKPLESCFVASLDLAAVDRRWEVSPVQKKLARVAFVAVHAERTQPLPARLIGRARLWSPSDAERAQLQSDYEEIVELIDAGFLDRVTAHQGVFLQLRPKGRSAAHLRSALDEEGAPVRAPPRAFYLRRTFVAHVLGG